MVMFNNGDQCHRYKYNFPFSDLKNLDKLIISLIKYNEY